MSDQQKFERWEYKKTLAYETNADELRELGSERWELVAVIPETEFSHATMYFKRRTQ